MPIVRTSAKGQVVIPAEIREEIGLKPGGKVLVTRAGERTVLIQRVPDDPIGAAHGMLKGGPSLTEALLVERREDRAREEEKLARFVRDARVPQRGRRVRKGSRPPEDR